MSRPVARVLASLQQVNEAPSIELETGTNLRQPEISIAMKQLIERDWIIEREEKKKSGKADPIRYIRLKSGLMK